MQCSDIPQCSVYCVHGGPKNWHNLLHALTLSNINRFSKLFHRQNQEKICTNTITMYVYIAAVRCRCGLCLYFRYFARLMSSATTWYSYCTRHSEQPTEHVDVAVGEDVAVFVAGIALNDCWSAVCFQRAVQVIQRTLAHLAQRQCRPVGAQSEVAR